MKATVFLGILSAGLACAEPPKKGPLPAYAALWTNSPFTSKPPDAGNAPVANPLDDYALGGVAPVEGGYRVTLLNKKNPEERILVESGAAATTGAFKILSVNRGQGKPLGTVVRLSAGGREGSVAFDEKLLTLKTAPAAQPQQPNNMNNPNLSPGALPPGVVPNNGQPAANGAPGAQPAGAQPVRQPRQRVVPAPAPSATNNGVPQPSNSSQRPTRR